MYVCLGAGEVSRGKRQRTLEPGNAADGYEMVVESPWKEPEQTSDFSFVSANFLICPDYVIGTTVTFHPLSPPSPPLHPR